jgi:hypothetical protein
VVHQAIQLNPNEERDMAVLQGLRNLGIEKGEPFAPTDAQKKLLEEAALVGETWAMGNSFVKPNPVKHWVDDPRSQRQYMLVMQSRSTGWPGTTWRSMRGPRTRTRPSRSPKPVPKT